MVTHATAPTAQAIAGSAEKESTRQKASRTDRAAAVLSSSVGSPTYDDGRLKDAVETLSVFQLHSDSLPGMRSVIEAIDSLGFGFRSSSEKKNRSAAKKFAIPKM